MDDFQRIRSAEWIGGVRLRLHFIDGEAGVVDLAPELGDDPGVLSIIRDQPGDVAVSQGGRALLWLDAAGEEIDLDADALRLRLRAEQAAA